MSYDGPDEDEEEIDSKMIADEAEEDDLSDPEGRDHSTGEESNEG